MAGFNARDYKTDEPATTPSQSGGGFNARDYSTTPATNRPPPVREMQGPDILGTVKTTAENLHQWATGEGRKDPAIRGFYFPNITTDPVLQSIQSQREQEVVNNARAGTFASPDMEKLFVSAASPEEGENRVRRTTGHYNAVQGFNRTFDPQERLNIVTESFGGPENVDIFVDANSNINFRLRDPRTGEYTRPYYLNEPGAFTADTVVPRMAQLSYYMSTLVAPGQRARGLATRMGSTAGSTVGLNLGEQFMAQQAGSGSEIDPTEAVVSGVLAGAIHGGVDLGLKGVYWMLSRPGERLSPSGIPLTRGEDMYLRGEGGAAQEIGQEVVVARQPGAEPIFREFRQSQNQAVRDIPEGFVDRPGAVTSEREAGEIVSSAARGEANRLRSDIAMAYESAFKGNASTSSSNIGDVLAGVETRLFSELYTGIPPTRASQLVFDANAYPKTAQLLEWVHAQKATYDAYAALDANQLRVPLDDLVLNFRQAEAAVRADRSAANIAAHRAAKREMDQAFDMHQVRDRSGNLMRLSELRQRAKITPEDAVARYSNRLMERQGPTEQLGTLDALRRHINGYINQARPGTEDFRALNIIKEAYDDQMQRLITKNLLTGDQQAVTFLTQARELNKAYRDLFGRQAGRDSYAQKVASELVDNNVNGVQAINYVFDGSRIFGSNASVDVINNVMRVTGNDPAVKNALQQALIIRIMGRAGNSLDAPRVGTLVSGIDEHLNQRNLPMMEAIFSPEQIAQLRVFREDLTALRGMTGIRGGASNRQDAFTTLFASKVPKFIRDLLPDTSAAQARGMVAGRPLFPVAGQPLATLVGTDSSAMLFSGEAAGEAEQIGEEYGYR